MEDFKVSRDSLYSISKVRLLEHNHVVKKREREERSLSDQKRSSALLFSKQCYRVWLYVSFQKISRWVVIQKHLFCAAGQRAAHHEKQFSCLTLAGAQWPWRLMAPGAGRQQLTEQKVREPNARTASHKVHRFTFQGTSISSYKKLQDVTSRLKSEWFYSFSRLLKLLGSFVGGGGAGLKIVMKKVEVT